MDIWTGVFGMAGVLVGSATSICANWLGNKAQEKRLKHEIKAEAVQAEVAAFRDAASAAIDQVFAVHELCRRGPADDLVAAFFELDRRFHRLSLFGSIELINATSALSNGLNTMGVSGPNNVAQAEFHKAKTVWITLIRKEIIELRDLTLNHDSKVSDTTQSLALQMELLTSAKKENPRR